MRFEMGAAARRHAAQFATSARAGDWIEAYQQAYEKKHGHRVAPLVPDAELTASSAVSPLNPGGSL
jgi:hypothetical protein